MAIYHNIGDVWKASVLTGYVTVTADPSGSQSYGTSITFTATATNMAGISTYQWKLNGNNVGSNQNTYINSTLLNGDVIRCDVTSSTSWIGIIISNSIVASIEAPGKGYSLGGYHNFFETPQLAHQYVSEIDGINFPNDAQVNPAAALTYVTGYGTGISSSSKGYCCGGADPGNYVSRYTIQALKFSDESIENPSATLLFWRGNAGGVSTSTKGYVGGGQYQWGSITADIEGLTYSGETNIDVSASLVSQREAVCGAYSSSKGYFLGGHSYTEIDGIQFSDESAINPSATLSSGRNYMGSVTSSLRGYAAGGANTYSTIDGIKFSDETAITAAGTLSTGRYATTGFFSVLSGYFSSGSSGGNALNLIDKMVFSSESVAAISATPVVRRLNSCGVQTNAW